MAFINEISESYEEMKSWRRDIHAYPELGFEEKRTSDFVAKKLEEFGCEVHRGFGVTGVVGTIRAGNSTNAIGLRADFDALPIEEDNIFEHRSTLKGKMHACGHDGHTAMLLGAAKYLSATRKFDGLVHCIFQPAEEGLGGAKKMIEDGLFEKFPCKSIFAMHNKPGLQVGKFAVNAGPTMAAGAFFDIEIIGKGAHAAKPETSVDPIVVASQLIVALQSIISRNVDPKEISVLSVTKIHSGDAYNVIPQSAKFSGTVRTFSDTVMNEIETRIESMTRNLCQSYNANCEISFNKNFASLVNDDQEAEFAYRICKGLVGEEHVLKDVRSMASEDFSFMLKEVPGCYINIGNGVGEGGCEVHNPSYDFNDNILVLGASYFSKIVEEKLIKC